jgi:hypothetical protein
MSIFTKAIKDNFAAAYEKLSESCPLVTFHRSQRSSWMETEISVPMFNRVFTYTKPDNGDLKSDVQAIAGIYKQRGHRCNWLVYSDEADLELEEALMANGFIQSGSMSGMALALENWTIQQQHIEGLEIRKVQTSEELELFKKTMVAGYKFQGVIADAVEHFFADTPLEDSSVQRYVAFMNGIPVTTVVTVTTGFVTGCYAVATMEEYRARGLAGATVARALLDRQAEGVQIATLQASDMGKGVYLNLGFKEELTIQVYTN